MPIGAGGMSGANCQASPPSPSDTTRGTLSWNFFGMYVVHRCGGSRTWESAEISLYWRVMSSASFLSARPAAAARVDCLIRYRIIRFESCGQAESTTATGAHRRPPGAAPALAPRPVRVPKAAELIADAVRGSDRPRRASPRQPAAERDRAAGPLRRGAADGARGAAHPRGGAAGRDRARRARRRPRARAGHPRRLRVTAPSSCSCRAPPSPTSTRCA